MSFSPRNVSQLLVAKTSSSLEQLSAVGDFAVTAIADDDAAIGQLKNKGVYITVKTANGIKTSEFIPAGISAIESTAKALVLGSKKLAYTAPADFINVTVKATIVVNDNIGAVGNERFISAYVVTDGNGNFVDQTGATVAATLELLLKDLEAQFAVLAKKEFSVTATTTELIITEVSPEFSVGVKDGAPAVFSVLGGIDTPAGDIPAVASIIAQGTMSDVMQLKNIEWFNSGYDKDPYRETGYPSSFAADSNVAAAGIVDGDAYAIFQFYKERDAVNIERQHRQIIIVGAGASAVNTAITELQPAA